jgi:hypothetical protein
MLKVDIERIEEALNSIEKYLFENNYSDVEKYLIYMILAITRRTEMQDLFDEEDMENIDTILLSLMKITVINNSRIKIKNTRKVEISDGESEEKDKK